MTDSCTAVMPPKAQSVAAMERTAFAAFCAEVSQLMKSSDSTTLAEPFAVERSSTCVR